jgi:hypothetical protein
MPYGFQYEDKAEFAGGWAVVLVRGPCPAVIDGCGGCHRSISGCYSFCELGLCTDSQGVGLATLPCSLPLLASGVAKEERSARGLARAKLYRQLQSTIVHCPEISGHRVLWPRRSAMTCSEELKYAITSQKTVSPPPASDQDTGS